MKHLQKLFVLLVLLSFMVSACSPSVASPTAAPASSTEAPASQSEPASEVKVVKVGALYPLTGSMALNGQNHKMAHEFALREINGAGGIECLGGAKLEIVYGDSQGTPEKGNAETERLINKEGVVAMIGAFDSGTTLAATEVAERYKTPFIVSTGVATQITERGLKYTFKTSASIALFASETAKFVKEMGVTNGVILAPNYAFGQLFSTAWSEVFTELGLQELDNISFAAGGSDYTDVILNIKAKDPEVIFFLADTSDAILILRQMQELGYYPKQGIVTGGGGLADPAFVQGAGAEAVEGILMIANWWPELNLPGSKEINAAFEKEYGINMAGDINSTYFSTWLVAEALERACSTDREALANVLRTTKFEEGPWNMNVPYIQFDEKGMNITNPYIIAQYQDGKAIPVWPAEYAVGEVVWPVPGWGER